MNSGDQVMVVLRVTTDAQDRRLSLMARRRRFDSAVTLGRDFEQTYGYRISAQSVRNRLHAANLRTRKPVVRPPLTHANKEVVLCLPETIHPLDIKV